MVEDKEQRIETLQDRVDELEATVSKMLPSRRDALKLGAAGAVGAVGMAGSASAQNSNQVGTIGTDSDRVDVNAEDIDAVSVNTGELTDGVVGSGNNATLLPYDAGDLIHVASFDFYTEGSVTISSTSFTDVFSVGPQIGDMRVFGGANQNLGSLKTLVTGAVESVDSQITVRTVISPDSEITLTSSGNFGGPGDIGDCGYSSGRLRPEAKVDSGSATLSSPGIHFFREVV